MGRGSSLIITTAQAKTLLQISGSSYDSLIAALIPEAEAKYLQIRNIPFTQIRGDIATGDATISNIELYPQNSVSFTNDFDVVNPANFINRLEYIFNSTYAIDDYVTDIDGDNNTIEVSTNSTATATDVIFTVYPQGAKMAASKIISYMLNKNAMNGMQSESIGSYSYSKGSDSNQFGIPLDIVQSIKRYVNV